uniref:C2H2-type domain-containing protein n=1 Tax=Acrobeloides nanus TaxID=290746 RepID=A0A914CIF9_9BILA
MAKIYWDGRIKIREAVRESFQNSIYTTKDSIQFHDIFHDGWVEFSPNKKILEVYAVEDRPYLKKGKTAHATSETMISLDQIKSLGPIVYGHIFSFKYLKIVKNIIGIEQDVLLELIFEGTTKEVQQFYDTIKENCKEIIIETTPTKEVQEKAMGIKTSATPISIPIATQKLPKTQAPLTEPTRYESLSKSGPILDQSVLLSQAKIVFDKSGRQNWKCECCDVICNSTEQFISHSSGEKHKKKAEKDLKAMDHNHDGKCTLCDNKKPIIQAPQAKPSIISEPQTIQPHIIEEPLSSSILHKSDPILGKIGLPSQKTELVIPNYDRQGALMEPKVVYSAESGHLKLKCEICDVVCSPDQFSSHANGSKHKKKCEQMKVIFKWEHMVNEEPQKALEEKLAQNIQELPQAPDVVTIPDNPEPSTSKDKTLKRFCGICQVAVPKDTWKKHEASLPHKIKHYQIRMNLTAGDKAIVPSITYEEKIVPVVQEGNKRTKANKRRRQNKRQRELQEIAERIEAKARKYIEESSNEEEESEENGLTRKRYKGPRKRKPKPITTVTNDILSKMADPTQPVLRCEICDIPIGDEKMLDAHEATKAHRHMTFRKLAEEQAKDPKIGKWKNRISHREYWYATYWTPPCNNFFCEMDARGNDYDMY